MQKIIRVYAPTDSDIDDINDELTKGWNIKQMVGVGDTFIAVLEKETRKEKLDKIDDISTNQK